MNQKPPCASCAYGFCVKSKRLAVIPDTLEADDDFSLDDAEIDTDNGPVRIHPFEEWVSYCFFPNKQGQPTSGNVEPIIIPNVIECSAHAKL